MKNFVFTFVIQVYATGMLFAQQADWSFSSGRLYKDPVTGKVIHSPYLALQRKGEQQWIAYDAGAGEGRFLDVSSSYTGAIACGYVKGSFDFLGKKVWLPESRYTAVAVSVSLEKKLKWMYTRQSAFEHSVFSAVVKLPDGRAIISGYEYNSSLENGAPEYTGILLGIDRDGAVLWEKRVPGAKGYGVEKNGFAEVWWMIAAQQENNAFNSQVQRIDVFTGQEVAAFSEEGIIKTEGIKGSPAFTITADASLLTLRLLDGKPDALSVCKYKPDGRLVWDRSFAVKTGRLTPRDIIEKADGNILVSASLEGDLTLDNGRISIPALGELDILLLNLKGNGNFSGYRLYGNDYAGVNSFFKAGDKVGIAGCHYGDLAVGNQLLRYDRDSEFTQAYQVLLSEGPVAKGLPEFVMADSTSTPGNLKIYPNPVKEGVVTIVNEQVSPDGIYRIDLYDNSRRLQISIGKIPTGTFSSDRIDVSWLPAGLYHVFFSQNSRLNSTGRFIITK